MTAAAAVLAALALVILPGRVGAVHRLRRLHDPAHRDSPPLQAFPAQPDALGVASALDLLAACLRAGLPTARAA
ncbi:type II secretion system F family protein, partial [Nocardia tengchongensis]